MLWSCNSAMQIKGDGQVRWSELVFLNELSLKCFI